jgi:hypothetical protein
MKATLFAGRLSRRFRGPSPRGRSAVLKDPVLGDATIGKRVRRRRSWYRRRLRKQRALIAVVVGTVFAAACWQNVSSYFSSPSTFGSQPLPGSVSTQAQHKNHGLVKAESPRPTRLLVRIPGVYPYSVVPGGVKDSNDLRMAAEHDAAVRRHYAHFDFSNARLIRNAEAREVYLSYRIRDTVFWTRKKVRLLPGELLLTDGKITARAHCGNQISDTAKPEVSDEEPSEDVLDQPVAIEPTAAFPARPALAPDLPAATPTPPQLFGGGFVFPYVSFAGPYPVSNCPAGEIDTDKHCHKRHKPPISPEPSTMVLLGSGLALIFWRYRHTRPAIT